MLEVAPLVAGDETGGYWTYLRLCGDEMASDAPVLFDPRNPLLTLSPSVAALDGLVACSPIPLPRRFGQRQTRSAGHTSSSIPATSAAKCERSRQLLETRGELAVRNQFFTPRYVVDFLVQNTLGRRLLEAQTDSALIDALPLLVDPPTEQGEPLPLDKRAHPRSSLRLGPLPTRLLRPAGACLAATGRRTSRRRPAHRPDVVGNRHRSALLASGGGGDRLSGSAALPRTAASRPKRDHGACAA